MKNLALILLVCFLCGAAKPVAAPPPPPAPPPRIDFHTVLLEPAPSGRVRVTAFFGFDPLVEGATTYLFIPVDGEPQAMKAQAMDRADFDARYVHRSEMEGAFYSWSRAQRNADWLVRSSIGLGGGIPAWLVLAAQWPKHGPAITAVVPGKGTPGRGYAVAAARLLVSEEDVKRLPAEWHGQAGAALRRSNSSTAIAVALRPEAGFAPDPAHPASHGVRISYEAPLRHEAGRRVFLIPAVAGTTPVLTRLYARSPWQGRLEVELPADTAQSSPSQRVVERALQGYDQDATSGARPRSVNVTTVRALDGRFTTRLVGAFGPWAEDAAVVFDFSPVETLSPVRTGMGAGLLLAAWPAALLAYLVVLLGAARLYLWLIGAPSPALDRKRFILLAALGPLATPWVMLRALAPKELPEAGSGDDGALSVMKPRDYDAVARVVVWGVIVCVNWLIVLTIVRVGLALRYG